MNHDDVASDNALTPVWRQYLMHGLYVIFWAAASFFLVPGFMRKLDNWWFLSHGVGMPMWITLVMAASFLILFICLTRVATLGMVSLWPARVLTWVSYTVIILGGIPLFVNPDMIRSFRESPKYLIIEDASLYAQFGEFISPDPRFHVVESDLRSTAVPVLAGDKSLYPRNMYYLRGGTEVTESGLTVTAVISQASTIEHESADISWVDIDSLRETFPSVSGAHSAIDSILLNAMNLPLDPARVQCTTLYSPVFRAYGKYIDGRCLYESGKEDDLQMAIAAFEEALTLDSTFSLARMGLADCYCQLFHRLWRPERATLDSVRFHLSHVPDSSAVLGPYLKSKGLYFQTLAVWFQHSAAYLEGIDSGNTTAIIHRDSMAWALGVAEQYYKKSIATKWDPCAAQSNLALVLLSRAALVSNSDKRQFASLIKESRGLLESTIRSNPFYVPGYVNLGVTYISEFVGAVPNDSSLLRQGIEKLERATLYIERETSLGMLYYNLACLHSRLGHFDQARRYLDLSLRTRAFDVESYMVGNSAIPRSADEDLCGLWESMTLDEINEIFVSYGLTPLSTKPCNNPAARPSI